MCVDGWMCVCVTAWGSRRGCRPPSLPPLGGDVCVPPPGPGGGAGGEGGGAVVRTSYDHGARLTKLSDYWY